MASPFRYPYISTLLLSQQYPTTADLLVADAVETSFKTAQQKFENESIAVEEIKDYFEKFKTLKPRIKKDSERDIDQWAKQGWQKFKAFVDELGSTKSKQQIKKEKKMEGAELIAENDDWRVYRITTHEAAMLYGANTKWCITEPNGEHWSSYIRTNNFYFILSKTDRDDPTNKIALSIGTDGVKSYWDDLDQHYNQAQIEQMDLNFPAFKARSRLSSMARLMRSMSSSSSPRRTRSSPTSCWFRTSSVGKSSSKASRWMRMRSKSHFIATILSSICRVFITAKNWPISRKNTTITTGAWATRT